MRYEKRIKTHEIQKPPVFILGYYRSGTTFLQRMLMQDPSLRTTSLFQTVMPEIMLSSEKTLTPVMDGVSRLFKIQNQFHRIPLRWRDFPGEEDVALGSLFRKQASTWGILFPEKFIQHFDRFFLLENMTETELNEWSYQYDCFIKKVSLACHSSQLVLKNPPNTGRVKQLLKLYPEAKFIHIVRNPADVFLSNRLFWQAIKKNYMLGKSRNLSFDELIKYSYSGLMNKYLNERDLIPAGNLIEIQYENFISNPVLTLESIYNKLGLEGFENARTSMMQFSSQQGRYPRLKHQPEECPPFLQKEWKHFFKFWAELSRKKQTHLSGHLS
jgi:hypothetical protein